MTTEMKPGEDRGPTSGTNENGLSAADKRKRKILLAFPLLCLPFIALAFWALGGGSGKPATPAGDGGKEGLNPQLPGANLKGDRWLDKLAYYEKAEADSAKQRERNGYDKYYFMPALEGQGAADADKTNALGLYQGPGEKGGFGEREAMATAKIKALDRLLEQGEGERQMIDPAETGYKGYGALAADGSAGRGKMEDIESLLEELKHEPGSKDSEMEQLNGLLEKILAIQRGDNLKTPVISGGLTADLPAQRVEVPKSTNNISIMDALAAGFSGSGAAGDNDDPAAAFFSVEQPMDTAWPAGNAIRAVVDGTRTVADGATVAIRLADETRISGRSIPASTLVYGLASLNGERLRISVMHIRYGNALIPVSLSVFDMDGVEGIYVPGAISRDVAKSGFDRVAQGIGMTTPGAGIGSRAATAGIEAAKSLIGKKARQQRVILKAGYQILLYNSSLQGGAQF